MGRYFQLSWVNWVSLRKCRVVFCQWKINGIEVKVFAVMKRLLLQAVMCEVLSKQFTTKFRVPAKRRSRPVEQIEMDIFLLTISLNDATHFDEKIDMSEQDLDRISVFSLLGTVIINQGLIWMNLNQVYSQSLGFACCEIFLALCLSF